MRVTDVMTRDPITIDPEAPIGTALAVMREQRVRHLPVVDDQGQLMGIITDRDLRHAAFGPALTEYLSARARRRAEALSARLDDVRVRDVMTWGVATTSIIPSSGLATSGGSGSKTSSPAPARWPSRRASTSAASSTTGPRLTLIR